MYKYLFVSFLLLFIFNTSLINAQGTRSTLADTSKVHSPQLATLFSAIVPGAGQVYNKKYWKVPIIYAVGGALIYSTIFNHQKYNDFLGAYTYLLETDNEQKGFENYPLDQLKSIKDQYRRYRDLSVIGLGLLYVLNIVDATVDGHLFDYDVGDDLSLRIEPNIMKNPISQSQQLGFKCTLNF